MSPVSSESGFIRFISVLLGDESRGVMFLGLIGVLAVAGVLAVSLGENEQTKVTTKPAAAAPPPGGGQQATPAPTAAPVTTTQTQDSNPITVLAAIATAAVGGIAGAVKGGPTQKP